MSNILIAARMWYLQQVKRTRVNNVIYKGAIEITIIPEASFWVSASKKQYLFEFLRPRFEATNISVEWAIVDAETPMKIASHTFSPII